jgi:hypothetical protein
LSPKWRAELPRTPPSAQFSQPCGVGPGLDGGDACEPSGFVFGVFGGIGFEDGGVGTSGAEFGIDGDAGGVGVCVVQPTAMALSAIAARMIGEGRVAFMGALLRKSKMD